MAFLRHRSPPAAPRANATTAFAADAKNATAGAQKTGKEEQVAVSFPAFYNAHATGRGIWKWNNALDAYQRHFGALAGSKVSLAEVGVQSGGSILMWQAVLGAQCHVFGLDINKKCEKFTNDETTIVIGDQGDVGMWQKFFSETTPNLDILVDDGGHQAHQMLTTMQQSFPKINPGGFVSIEDIHGRHYVQSFFAPAAQYLAEQHAQGLVKSVHVYPFLLVVRKTGNRPGLAATELVLTPAGAVVESFEAMWAALPANLGKSVTLMNAGWGSTFLEKNGLQNAFAQFAGLHDSSMWDDPKGCSTTAAAVCTNSIVNSQEQAMVSGVHVYADRLIVEVPATPPLIVAVRRGTEFLPYGFL